MKHPVTFASELEWYEYDLAWRKYITRDRAVMEVIEVRDIGNKDAIEQRQRRQRKLECLRKAIKSIRKNAPKLFSK